MKENSHRRFAVLVAGTFAVGVLVGAAFAPAPTAPAIAAAEHREAAEAHEPASATGKTTPLSAPRPPFPQGWPAHTAQPLPPAEAPVAAIYDQLAARARAGDAAAARRLADDLKHCLRGSHSLISLDRADAASLTDAQRLSLAAAKREHDEDAHCAGTTALATEASMWIEQAARSGDPEAMLCYTLSANDWHRNWLSPRWQQHAEQAYAQSPQWLARAFAAGQPEAAAILSRMHVPHSGMGSRWYGRMGVDPYKAYAYALVAADTLPGKRRTLWQERARELALPLSPAQRAQARVWASERSRRMTLPPLPEPGRRTRGREFDCATIGYLASQL